jgi:phosphonate transport system substrate-binding protein
MRRYLARAALAIILLIGAISTRDAGAQARQDAKISRLSLGLVSDSHHKQIEAHFRGLVGYVARKLYPGEEIDARVVVAATSFELAKLLEQRKVDFFMESAYPTYVINFVHGAGTLLLRRWKGGMPDYHSVIFTRRDSGINRLDDLRGTTIVFEDPGSTSGYLLPKLFLLRQGLKLAEKGRFDPSGAAPDVGYFFARSQDRMVELVLAKQAAAGAFSSDDYSGLDEKKSADIAILAQTERLPRHLVSVRRDLVPGVVARLRDVLLQMHEDAEGRKILQKTDGTTKFDMLPGGEATMRRRLLDSFYSRSP